MQVSILLVTLASAITSVSAECYRDGLSISTRPYSFEVKLIEQYCRHANGHYNPQQTWKWCYSYGGHPAHYLLLEFKRNGDSGPGKDLSYGACQAYLNEIWNECLHGGRKESGDGWSYRLDPGTSCDGRKPDIKEMTGVQI